MKLLEYVSKISMLTDDIQLAHHRLEAEVITRIQREEDQGRGQRRAH
jgi:hypothetical protein